jgi:DNA-binding MarR family transcriptional regulator
VLVALIPAGRGLLARARPVHAVAVREHLLNRLSEEERTMLVRVAARLAEPPD